MKIKTRGRHLGIQTLALLLSVVVLNGTRPAFAIDESESFALLVETIGSTDNPKVQAALMQGMLRGLEGRRQVDAPKGWSELSQRLAASEDSSVRERSLSLSQIFGDESAVQHALDLVQDKSVDIGRRRSTLNLLLTQQNRDASALLLTLIDEPQMRLDAIRGLAVVDNSDGPTALMTRYASLDDQLKRAVIETLSARKSYAQFLMGALEKGELKKEDIPTPVARSLTDLLGERFTKVFGDVRPVAADRTKMLARYKKMCNEAAIADASASRGRKVFQKTCASCHVLYGEGGKVGPDLTGSNRANLDYILLNSVDPSYDVPDAYRTVSVLTVDGRSVNGVLAEEDATRIVLKTPEQPRVVIAKEDIEARRVSPKSMMPDGQLDQMETQEVLDLIKYLRTSEQVEMSK